jgi:RimJ/RimL family protein N-acetyltransferase
MVVRVRQRKGTANLAEGISLYYALKCVQAASAPMRPRGKLKSKMPFELQPNLKGRLVELRPLRAEDFDDLYAVAADPLIWEQHPVRDRYQEEVFKAFFHQALDSRGALITVDAQNGRVIGSSRFHGYSEEKSEVEIGWTFLARSHWGGAYNGEMKQLMLRHAFRFVNSVIFLVGPQNLRSQRAVEKLGGVCVGTRPDAGGRESFIYRITTSIFAQQSGGGVE